LNRDEEDKCLRNVKETIKEENIGAIIVEPITFRGGHMATPSFFSELR